MKIGRIEFFEDLVGLPPHGWHLGHVKIRSDQPAFIVECWQRGPLGVHTIEREGRQYGRISHVPTGFEISTFETTDLAVEAAEMIEPLADWDNLQSASPELKDKVRATWERRWSRQELAADGTYFPVHYTKQLTTSHRPEAK